MQIVSTSTSEHGYRRLDARSKTRIFVWPKGESIMDNLEKIRRIREAGREELHIAVDGGINEQTAGLVCAAGADVLVAGTFLFGSSNMKEKLASLRRSCALTRE